MSKIICVFVQFEWRARELSMGEDVKCIFRAGDWLSVRSSCVRRAARILIIWAAEPRCLCFFLFCSISKLESNWLKQAYDDLVFPEPLYFSYWTGNILNTTDRNHPNPSPVYLNNHHDKQIVYTSSIHLDYYNSGNLKT